MFTLSEVFEISPEYHPMLHYFLLSDTKSDILNILPPSRIFKISGRDKLCLKSTGCRDNNFGGVHRATKLAEERRGPGAGYGGHGAGYTRCTPTKYHRDTSGSLQRAGGTGATTHRF